MNKFRCECGSKELWELNHKFHCEVCFNEYVFPEEDDGVVLVRRFRQADHDYEPFVNYYEGLSEWEVLVKVNEPLFGKRYLYQGNFKVTLLGLTYAVDGYFFFFITDTGRPYSVSCGKSLSNHGFELID